MPRNPTHVRGRAILRGALVLVFSAAAITARAAELPEFTEPLDSATDTGEITLLPSRSEDVIRQNIDDAKAMQIAAQDRRKRAEGQQTVARSFVEARRKDIESLKARLKVAKDQKNEADKLDLERQIKTDEAIRTLLEKESAMRDAERDAADADKEHCAALVDVFEKELDLIRKQFDLSVLKGDPAAGSQIDRLVKSQKEIREQERRVIEAMKEASAKNEDAAGKAKAVFERRLEVFEARLSTE